ncbi:hypothetical protein TNCV_2141971 [Trichonephila clavipes]|uniref:Transposase n=1 Tax=Trichonephila clavipes TaxID=2585209 RepID=A0A8X6RXV8_TRICX|nr:hypothetical protein TNCV_2141971 [Trichonephila clavipes]
MVLEYCFSSFRVETNLKRKQRVCMWRKLAKSLDSFLVIVVVHRWRLLTNEKISPVERTKIGKEKKLMSPNSSWQKKVRVQTEHPPYSPDLNPPDFFLFLRLKIALKENRLDDIPDT